MASFDDKPIHYFTSTAEWEAFPASDPPDDGVRLKLRKKASLEPGILWQEALDVALCYGWIDGQSKRVDDDFQLQAFTPRRRSSPWSQINREHVARLIAEGRMKPGGHAEIERAKADGRWDAAYRTKNAPVPAELQAALDASPGAAAGFAALSAQSRWAILFRLSQAKQPQTVTRNIAKYVGMLERGEPIL